MHKNIHDKHPKNANEKKKNQFEEQWTALDESMRLAFLWMVVAVSNVMQKICRNDVLQKINIDKTEVKT